MARIQVQSGYEVDITSSVEADASQRFRVYRQVGNDPEPILLDTIPGGGRVRYQAWNKNSVYHIFCEGIYPRYWQTLEWKPSREDISTSNRGKTVTIRCEDYWSTDGDWNDLIVTVRLVRSDRVADASEGTNPYFSESNPCLR